MSYFVYKLVPSRTTFSQDMTDAEAKMMSEHVAYWNDLANRGVVIIFGPVLEPKGMWGLAIVEAKDKSEVIAYAENDPAIRANMGFLFEIYPMAQAILRK